MSSLGEYLAKRNSKYRKMLEDENYEIDRIINNDLKPVFQTGFPEASLNSLEN